MNPQINFFLIVILTTILILILYNLYNNFNTFKKKYEETQNNKDNKLKGLFENINNNDKLIMNNTKENRGLIGDLVGVFETNNENTTENEEETNIEGFEDLNVNSLKKRINKLNINYKNKITENDVKTTNDKTQNVEDDVSISEDVKATNESEDVKTTNDDTLTAQTEIEIKKSSYLSGNDCTNNKITSIEDCKEMKTIYQNEVTSGMDVSNNIEENNDNNNIGCAMNIDFNTRQIIFNMNSKGTLICKKNKEYKLKEINERQQEISNQISLIKIEDDKTKELINNSDENSEELPNLLKIHKEAKTQLEVLYQQSNELDLQRIELEKQEEFNQDVEKFNNAFI